MRCISISAGLLLVLPLISGCGSTQAKVSGQVLLDNEPLPGGRITFLPADPKQTLVRAELDENGKYEAVLPVGEVKICVDNRHLAPHGTGAKGGLPRDLPISQEVRKTIGSGAPEQPSPKSDENTAKKPAGKYLKIADRYYTVEKSGLQFTVARGRQQHDIKLTK
jgi:hypothetical protein